jgi:hypothetical protein
MVHLEIILCGNCGNTLHIYRHKHDINKINNTCLNCNITNNYLKATINYDRKNEEQRQDIKDFLINASYYISRGK